MPMIDDMLVKAFARLDAGVNPVLHSDQGWQYRHRWYQYQLREFGVIQSKMCIRDRALPGSTGTDFRCRGGRAGGT